MKGRIWFSIAMTAIGTGLLVAAGFARRRAAGPRLRPRATARGGTLRDRLSTPTSTTSIRASPYFPHSWQMLNATQLKLLSFPDKEGAAGSRMRPEAAAGFPKVSRDGKTYTFTIKQGLQVLDGTAVTAANFARLLKRGAQPEACSRRRRRSSTTSRATGRERPDARRPPEEGRAGLPGPDDDAVLRGDPDEPADRRRGRRRPAVSAGPYYIREWKKNRLRRSSSATRTGTTPRSRGSRSTGRRTGRPDHFTIGHHARRAARASASEQRDRPRRRPAGRSTPRSRREFGINKGRFFIRKNLVFWYLALNNDSALFKNNVKLRQAVNHAIDRPQIVRQHGFLGGGRTDQILPPGMPGFKDGEHLPAPSA